MSTVSLSQTYMLPDGTKSNEVLTNGSGASLGPKKYEAFGAVKSGSWSTSTDFQYGGEQQDSALGLIYLRARYYDPATGRFLSKDPAGGKSFDSESLRLDELSSPVTQNKYVYANNNPVNAGDPTGMVFLVFLRGRGIFRMLSLLITGRRWVGDGCTVHHCHGDSLVVSGHSSLQRGGEPASPV